MVERIVKAPLLVVRDGRQVAPEVGKTFEFNDKELAEINKLQPTALGHVLRESDVEAEAAVPVALAVKK